MLIIDVRKRRQERIKHLKGIARETSEDPLVVEAIVKTEAIRLYGVSRKTARGYAQAVLVQLGHKVKWYAPLLEREDKKDGGQD